ncbi:hypothetical protein [Bacteroides ihuae]|nr:hypothetical protein [Bacteroides ihuae]
MTPQDDSGEGKTADPTAQWVHVSSLRQNKGEKVIQSCSVFKEI